MYMLKVFFSNLFVIGLGFNKHRTLYMCRIKGFGIPEIV